MPESFWKKRKTEDEDLKKSRLEKAVAACKDGKMSQAAAAAAYSIPKTTIWRKLQQESKKGEDSTTPKVTKRRKNNDNSIQIKSEVTDEEYSLCEVSLAFFIIYQLHL